MKKIITTAIFITSTSVFADFHSADYDWNNDKPQETVTTYSQLAISPVFTNKRFTNLEPQKQFAYRYKKDNGFFGYNPYNYFDPRWAMEEMNNMID